MESVRANKNPNGKQTDSEIEQKAPKVNYAVC